METEEFGSEIARRVIRPRPSQSHKGNYGRLLLIGGSENFGGAIMMAAEAAVSSGAGLTSVATDPANLTALHARVPEAMFMDIHEQARVLDLLKKQDVILCGPGLGNSPYALELLTKLCQLTTSSQSLVLDASALNLLAQHPDLLSLIKAKQVVLTPHQMEWQRLSGIKISDQENVRNFQVLRQLFPKRNVILVLKSNHTHVYDATQERAYLNAAGNPGMATGGMGDTLAGIIAAFLGQFGPSLDAVLAAVHCHSAAGDLLYQDKYLVRPTEISAMMPKLMKRYSNE